MDTTVKLKLGFAALMIASGIGVAMYPVISNAVAQRHASSVIEKLQRYRADDGHREN